LTEWWEQHPAVKATLNPPLLGAVTAWAGRGYAPKAASPPMPWPLAFVAVPLVMHLPTREALPGSTAKRFGAWQRENSRTLAGTAERCAELVPLTLAGLRWGLRGGLLAVEGPGLRGLLPAGANIPPELLDTRRAALLVGRWLAALPVATVLHTLGLAV